MSPSESSELLLMLGVPGVKLSSVAVASVSLLAESRRRSSNNSTDRRVARLGAGRRFIRREPQRMGISGGALFLQVHPLFCCRRSSASKIPPAVLAEQLSGRKSERDRP